MDALWRGNLNGLKKSLALLGLDANTFFTLDSTLDEFKNSSAAELNVVVSDIYGHDAAKSYEEEHGVPYIVSSFPIGPTATGNLLVQIAEALNLDADVSRIIEEQRRKYFRSLETIVDCYHDADLQRRTIVIADVNYAVSSARFLFDDLGWIPELIQFTDLLTPEQESAVSEKASRNKWGIEPIVVFDTAASEAIRYINERYPKKELDMYADSFTPGFVIGSSLERDIAAKLGAAHLSVSFPISNRAIINRGYTGFEGGLTFTEDLLSAAVAGR
jgi:nitrogenase molybdenum-iron protein beta chain